GSLPGLVPRIDNGVLTAYTIDTAQLSKATGKQLDPFYLQLISQQPGSLGEIGLPQLESGPYLSYGLQWLAFGVMAPIGVAYFVYSEVRHRRAVAAKNKTTGDPPTPPEPGDRAKERRRIRDELKSVSSGDGDAQRTEIGAGPQADDTADDQVKAKLAQRYGR
ncbi:MAG: hypothetical protein QM658_17850, partial [Gordonia sp. (in: high G+C Gram-positive bacteria)]